MPTSSIPIITDLITFDYNAFAENFKRMTEGRLFDVILIDPPWQLSGSNPT